MSSSSTIEELKALNDDALFALLKQNGLAVGPVQSTTRSLYEKRLIKHFKENRDSENSFNRSIADQSANNNEQQLPEQVIRSPSKRISKNFPNQQENENDDDIIVTHEVINPSPRSNKNKNADNLLDFKLLPPDNLNNNHDEREASMFLTQRISSTSYDVDRSTNMGLGNSPGRSILINRNRAQQPQQLDSRPRINWATDGGITQENAYKSASLYNAQPPPSPFRKETSSATGQHKLAESDSSSWSSFFKDKFKILAYFVLAICSIYFFIIYLQSYNLENPVDL